MENQWTELTCRVAVGDLDEMAAIAQMVVGAGLYIEDYSDLEEKTLEIAHIDLIDEELVAKDRAHALIHLYLPPEMSPAEDVYKRQLLHHTPHGSRPNILAGGL